MWHNGGMEGGLPSVMEGMSFWGSDGPPPSAEKFLVDKKENNLEFKREQAISSLEKMGVLHREKQVIFDGAKEKEEKFLVIHDLNFFKQDRVEFNFEGKRRSEKFSNMLDLAASGLQRDLRFGAHRDDRTLYYLFKDQKVITGSELSAAKNISTDPNKVVKELVLREMFYVPNSEVEAFDEDKIKEAEGKYYLYLTDVTRGWEKTYPTKQEEFGAKLTPFEAVVPSMIFGKGNGHRENGELIVDGHKITGRWFERFGWKTVNNRRWLDQGPGIIEEYGKRLTEKGLLMPDDVRINEVRRGETVQDNGNFYLPGSKRTYYLGRKFADCQVSRVADDEFLVFRRDVPVLWFNTNLDSKKLSQVIASENGVQWIPDGVFEKKQINKMKIRALKYDGGNRRKETIKVQAELPKLLKLRGELDQGFVGKNPLNDLTLVDQIAFSAETKDLDQKRLVEFITKTEKAGVRLIVDSFKHGGFDPKIFEVLDDFNEQTKEMFEKYEEFSKAVEMAGISLIKQIKDTMISEGRQSELELLTARITESLMFRSGAFFLVAANKEVALASKYLSLTTRSIAALADVLTPGSGKFALLEKPQPNYAKGGGKVTSVTWVYLDGDSNKLKITIRPEAVNTDDHSRAQARFNFTYTSREGDSLSLRVDRDDREVMSTSLDIGSHREEFDLALDRLGQSHHTQEAFEPVFYEPVVFARYMRALSNVLGYDFNSASSRL
jgi:hypothetical protein